MINTAVAHLQARGGGRLVGLSSIAGIRGISRAPAYAASKAFLSNYLHGLRYRFMRLGVPIIVTDVQPGFVDTRLAGARFWMASPEKAARQIVAAVDRGRTHVYVTKRWRLIAWLIRVVPDAVWGRV
jgi:short-subunit dehydrogenase